MITFNKILTILVGTSLLTGCGDLDTLNTNPDSTTSVTPAFMATGSILNLTSSSSAKAFLHDSWFMKQTSYTEIYEDYLYNRVTTSGFGPYNSIMNSDKMLELAEAEGVMPEGHLNAFRAYAHFNRAQNYYNMTMTFGDIPCSEAVKGASEGLFTPKYDSQESVLEYALKEFQEASRLFKEATYFRGDPIYDGDTDKWYRMTNVYTLRVLNMISKKENVGSINIRQRFEEVAALPLFTDEWQSFQRVYTEDKSAQRYPFYYKNHNFYMYTAMSSYLVNNLKELNDYRLFYYAEPASALSDKYPEDSFDAYSGVDPVMSYGEIQDQCGKGLHSAINNRYIYDGTCEPIKFVSYSEQEFMLAEGALRGWKTPHSAKEHYDNAVRAAMEFTAYYTQKDYRHNVTIDSDYINSYLAGKAAFNPSTGLQQIMMQKYIASLFQLTWLSYYDYRRTGLPQIPINPETNMNEVKTQMPVRWMYPTSEYSQNKDNVEAAIKSQYGGSDTPNAVMWLLK